MEFIHNPHCSKPFLAKDGTNWFVQFWYKLDGKRLPKKEAYDLNSSDFRVKVKGRFTEVNKVKRKEYADIYLGKLTALLNSRYFNPNTKRFETIDEADKTFIHFIELYLKSPYRVKEDSTTETYESYFNVFKKYLAERSLSDISLKDITKNLINDYVSQFKASHSNGNLRFLKAVVNYCVNDLEVIAQSQLKTIKYQPVDDSDSNKPYTDEEFKALLAVAKSKSIEFYILLLMGYYTLRRPMEILKLQYKDFNFADGTVYFSGSVTKTKKRQTAQLPKSLVELIASYITPDVKPEHCFLGTNKVGKSRKVRHELQVFNLHKATLEPYQGMFKTKPIQAIARDGQTIYSIKHTSVIALKKQGYSNQQIMGLTGHTRESTLGIYAREYKAAPINRKDDFLTD